MTLPLRTLNVFESEAGATPGPCLETSRAAVNLTRFKRAISDPVAVSSPSEDAHLLVFQLRDHPSHTLWLDGASQTTGPIARGRCNILDLRLAPTALFRSPVDSLHLRIPRAAIEDLAGDGDGAVDELRAPDGWSTLDPVLPGMEPLLLEILRRAGPSERLLVDHLLLALCLHLVETYGARKRPQTRKGGLAPWQVKRAQAMIAADLAAETPLFTIAASCGLSAAHFSRGFKASTGTTPHQWLQACRLDHARDLLKTRAAPIGDIATACGFADHSHLSRIFRRATGMTPMAYARLGSAGAA